MNFFKSVFSEDPDPTPLEQDPDSNPNSDQDHPKSDSSTGATISWGVLGGLVKTIASKSESVIQTYRRDLEEFGSGLKSETTVIREFAGRAVKDLPVSIEAGASVAQVSLESVGQAIDDIGASVWKGTTQIISQGREALLAIDDGADSSDNGGSNTKFMDRSVSSTPYSRFDARIREIQSDLNTYCGEIEDLDDFNKWELGFVLEVKDVEIEDSLKDNGVIGGIYNKLVPSTIDHDSFWRRYFYRVHKLKQAENARANLVKRAISGEDEEELSWDIDDDDDGDNDEHKGESSNVKNDSSNDSSQIEAQHKEVEKLDVEISKVEIEEKCLKDDKNDNGVDEKVLKLDEKVGVDGKGDASGSCKDSDVSVVSSQPSMPEEEDIGWDELEDIGSTDENKVSVVGSPSRVELRKQSSVADEEDLSWDIEDDDEPIKP